jgi:anti-sigma B factor antagonist
MKHGNGYTADDTELISVAVTVEPEAVIVAVAGEIDSTTAPALRTTVTELITGMRPAASGQRLVLDLLKVEFFNSCGAALMVDLHALAVKHDVTLNLALDRAGRVMRTLTITRLAELLPIYPSQAAAVRGPAGPIP